MLDLNKYVKYLIGEKQAELGDSKVNFYFLGVENELVLLINIDDSNIFYIPTLDVFLPEDITLVEYLIKKANVENNYQAVDSRNDNSISYDRNVYEDLRPPLSARLVWAEEIPQETINKAKEIAKKALEKIDSLEGKVTVYTEPNSPEFYKKGYEIEDTRDVTHLSKYIILEPDVMLNKLETAIDTNKEYIMFTKGMKTVTGKPFISLTDSDVMYYLINKEGTKNVELVKYIPLTKNDSYKEYPIGIPAKSQIVLDGIEFNLEGLPLALTLEEPINGIHKILVTYKGIALPVPNAYLSFTLDGKYEIRSHADPNLRIIFRNRAKPTKIADNVYVFPYDSKFYLYSRRNYEISFINSPTAVERYLSSVGNEIRRDSITGSYIFKNKEFKLQNLLETLANELLLPVKELEDHLLKLNKGGVLRILIIRKGKVPEIPKEAQEVVDIKEQLIQALQNSDDASLSMLFSSLTKVNTLIPEEIENIKEVLLNVLSAVTKLELSALTKNEYKEKGKLLGEVANYLGNAYKELVM